MSRLDFSKSRKSNGPEQLAQFLGTLAFVAVLLSGLCILSMHANGLETAGAISGFAMIAFPLVFLYIHAQIIKAKFFSQIKELTALALSCSKSK